MMSELTQVSRSKSFEGWTELYSHPSSSTQTVMKFAIYRPPQAEHGPVPVLYWLSGLTCTEENFITKAGAQRVASRLGCLLVAPDTSPRGAAVEGEDKEWDLGVGAGFYVDATEGKWARNYRMETYVTRELRQIVENNFPVFKDRQSIFGHSMGGHGAIVLALRHPGLYRSVSAFAPICAPSHCPWGEKAFSQYLGEDRKKWAQYDANELVRTVRSPIAIRIDQGEDDKFLKPQLGLDRFEATCRELSYPLEVRRRPGYDHSYYFIASFIEEHLEYHSASLKSDLR